MFDRSKLSLYAGLIMIAVLCSYFGFADDRKAFYGNLLSEFAGNAIGLLFGFIVIDRYMERLKQEQWEKVRRLTLTAIATHLCEIATQTWVHFSLSYGSKITSIFEGRGEPNRSVLTGFDQLLAELREPPKQLSKDDSYSDITAKLSDVVRWDVGQIQTILTPRVVQYSSDQSLIDALIEFDTAQRELQHAVIAHRQAVTQSAFDELISLIEVCRRLYVKLCESWEPIRASRS